MKRSWRSWRNEESSRFSLTLAGRIVSRTLVGRMLSTEWSQVARQGRHLHCTFGCDDLCPTEAEAAPVMGTKSLSLYKRLVVYVQPGFGVDLVMERIHFVAFMAVHVKNKAANEGNGLPSRPGAAEFGIKRRRRPFDVSLLSSIAPWSIRRRMTFMIAFSIAPSNLRFDLKKIASIYGSIPKLVLDFMYQIVHGYIRPEVLVRNAPGSG